MRPTFRLEPKPLFRFPFIAQPSHYIFNHPAVKSSHSFGGHGIHDDDCASSHVQYDGNPVIIAFIYHDEHTLSSENFKKLSPSTHVHEGILFFVMNVHKAIVEKRLHKIILPATTSFSPDIRSDLKQSNHGIANLHNIETNNEIMCRLYYVISA